MKSILLAITLLTPPDFNILADAIKTHEHSIKFPYGCEHRINGKLVGYPEPKARQICIKICRRSFAKWSGQGDFFQSLNKVYAADTNWYQSVEKIYNLRSNKQQTKQGK